MIRTIAVRYRDLGLPLDDLIQEGSLGLLEAIDGYEPRRSPDFDGYARFRVRRAIRNALTGQARLVRLPKHIVERRRALDRAEDRLKAAMNGRAPTPAELAAATGLSESAVLEARTAGLTPISLDQPRLPDGAPLADLIADPAASEPEHEALANEQSALLDAALATLSERKRYVVGNRLGLDRPPRRIVDLADELGLSTRRTQTIAADALHELKTTLGPDAAWTPD